MEQEKIENCPFCGADANLIHDTSSDCERQWNYFVECNNWSYKEIPEACGASSPTRKTAEEVIKVWNRSFKTVT